MALPQLRLSFRSKLMAALLGTVAVLLAVTLLVVRAETEGQIAMVAADATERSRSAFHELESFRRRQLGELASGFIGGRRTFAALEAAMEGGDVEALMADAAYELQYRGFERSLVGFTDAGGTPLLTLVDGVPVRGAGGADAARLAPLAAEILENGAPEVFGYRVVQDQLYLLQVYPVGLYGPPIGTVAVGVPVDDADAATLGEIAGGEVCLVAGGRCVAGTPRARADLAAVMEDLSGRQGSVMREAAGQRWDVIVERLVPARPSEGWRVIAVPLDPVLAPFDRIERALALAGIVALLLAVLASALLSRSLSRPLRALVAATGRVADGDFETHVEVSSGDELGRLASSFNEMTRGLRLKEQYRGVLDKVVSREIAEELLKGEVLLGGENREVTTLFADIEGFTPLSQGMPPQEVIALLNETMEHLTAAVEAEGGVVDKYVGDEVMALFGAPLSHGDDALRAVRAALRMRAAMARLNAERAERGQDTVHIAIGISTGLVVAGNMGSASRLNYTVVGEAVNLAARLCQSAGGGEILISEATRERVGDAVRAESLGERTLKGLSPVRLHRVIGLSAEPRDGGRRLTSGASASGLALLIGAAARALAGAAAVALAGAAPLAAQQGEGGLPTLRGLGLSWMSASGAWQLDLSGQLDVEAYAPGAEPAWLIGETEPFLAGRARLFADLFAGERVYGLLELRADRGEAPAAVPLQARVEQAFLRVTPLTRLPLAVQVGKFVTPFGAYPQRHHTQADPFIRGPLPYEWRTMVVPTIVPPGTERFVTWKDEPEVFRALGAPPVWGVPYQWGAMLLGWHGGIDVRAAVISAAPSSEPEAWGWDTERFRHPVWAAGAGWHAAPELRIGASWVRGPYIDRIVENQLPGRWERHDYLQEMWGLEGAWARGRIIVRGEAIADRWEVPNVSRDAWDISYYLEGEVALAPGLHAAARWAAIHFNELPLEGGGKEPWDHAVQRVQLGGGYRFLPNAGLKAEVQLTRSGGAADPRDPLGALQAWWAF